MSFEDDVNLVVEKIKTVMAEGEECSGYLSGKPAADWSAIFNAASKKLDIPVYDVAPLRSGSRWDILKNMLELHGTFMKAGRKPAIIIADGSGNHHVTDPDRDTQLADHARNLTQKYPKAIYLQVLTEAHGTLPEPITLYSLKPKTPRGPDQPIFPV